MTAAERVVADADAREPILRLTEDDLRILADAAPSPAALARIEAENFRRAHRRRLKPRVQ